MWHGRPAHAGGQSLECLVLAPVRVGRGLVVQRDVKTLCRIARPLATRMGG
ncbi:MAG: hypothetical protein RLZZ127_733, partial [Planctomycetota bacterium]